MIRIEFLHWLAALALAIVFLWLGALAADIYHLPLIHGWALAHGAILVVFPAYFVLAYFLLRPVAQRFQHITNQSEVPPRKLSALAVTAFLISGAGFFLPFVGSAAGVVAGHVAQRRFKSNTQLGGHGFAIAALVLGYSGLALWAYSFGMVSWVSSHHGS